MMKPALTALVLAAAATLAHAQDKVTFLTSWYAQAEHGGYYQAVATGIYRKHGLDVTIRMGVPLRLMRYRSCMIPTEVSGSRLPVGSSQTRSGGWLTNARAI